MSKNTSDVIGAVLAVIIFWIGIQYFISPDLSGTYEEPKIEIQEK